MSNYIELKETNFKINIIDDNNFEIILPFIKSDEIPDLKIHTNSVKTQIIADGKVAEQFRRLSNSGHYMVKRSLSEAITKELRNNRDTITQQKSTITQNKNKIKQHENTIKQNKIELDISNDKIKKLTK